MERGPFYAFDQVQKGRSDVLNSTVYDEIRSSGFFSSKGVGFSVRTMALS